MLPAGSLGSPWDDSVRLADKMAVPGLLSPIAISFPVLKRWVFSANALLASLHC
jgi:hypothetical protein